LNYSFSGIEQYFCEVERLAGIFVITEDRERECAGLPRPFWTQSWRL